MPHLKLGKKEVGLKTSSSLSSAAAGALPAPRLFLLHLSPVSHACGGGLNVGCKVRVSIRRVSPASDPCECPYALVREMKMSGFGRHLQGHVLLSETVRVPGSHLTCSPDGASPPKTLITPVFDHETRVHPSSSRRTFHFCAFLRCSRFYVGEPSFLPATRQRMPSPPLDSWGPGMKVEGVGCTLVRH